MGAAENRLKSQRNASDLVRRGIFHGKRLSKPHANSGGTTMTDGPGSSKYQRLMAALGRGSKGQHRA